jgi:TolA-binding protein
MNAFRASLIAALTMISWAAYAQVRIITPDGERTYSTQPGASVSPIEELQLENERARARILKQLERDQRDLARRRDELDDEYARLKAERAQREAQRWQNMEDQRIRDAGGQDNLAFGSRRNRY